MISASHLRCLIVLVLDARPWVQGDKVKLKGSPDWDSILVNAPVIKNQEIPEDSFVGVIHNIGHWGQDTTMISLNIFAVVIFYTRSVCSSGRR